MPAFFNVITNKSNVLPPLLDVYPGSGTALAVGVIKLRSAYTGQCIRVRRTSDNAEQNIGFDANGVLDVAAIATFCAGTTGRVRTIYNQNGSGVHIGQGTTSRQPIIYQSGAIVTDTNGFPAFLGNGTSTGMTFTSIIADGDSAFGIFSTNTTGDNILLGTSLTSYSQIRTSGNAFQYARVVNPYLSGTPDGACNISTGITTSNHIFYTDFGSSNLEGSVDNVMGTTFTKFGANTIDFSNFMALRIGLGGQTYMNGKAQICIIYNGSMRTDATAIVNHLNTQMSVY